jgi:hypothetical protein
MEPEGSLPYSQVPLAHILDHMDPIHALKSPLPEDPS